MHPIAVSAHAVIKPLVCRVILACVILLTLSCAQAGLAAAQDAESHAAPLTLNPAETAAFADIDSTWQAALAAVVAAEQAYLPGPAPYTLTAFDTYADAGGEWALAVIVPSAVVQAGWENLDLDQLVDVLLHRTPDGRIEGHVRANPAFLSLAAVVPTQLVDYSPLPAVGPRTQEESAGYLFPWTAGQTWWGGGGWHTGYGANALDFGPFPANVANGVVLASAGGTLRMVCENDSEQRLLWIEHPNGERTGYLHLDRASVAAVEDRQLIGQVVPQGAYLGTVYTGEAKIDGACPASFPNCTFNTICGYGSAPHVHFVLPSRNVIIDGITADAIGSGNAGDRFTSSNRRQDAAPDPQPEPDTEPPSAVLTAPISGSLSLTPTAAAVVPVELTVTDTGGSGVRSVQVQLAWQNAADEWIATDWVTATAAAGDVYTATFSACSPAWRVPHNRPLRVGLDLADGAGNCARAEYAGSFRYTFPDLNADCIVEIKDLLDLLPALLDSTKARPEHDVNGDGSLDAADAAALLAAVFGGWNEDSAPSERDGGRHAISVTYAATNGKAARGFPGMGSRVTFVPLSAPAGLDSARDVVLLGSTALVADWRGGGLALVDVTQPLSATIKARLPLSDRTYGVTAAGSLAYVSDPQEAASNRLAVLDLSAPLTPALAAALPLPGEVMESALASDHLYVAAGYAGLHAIDVATPQTPTLIGTFDTPGIATDVSAAGDIVYVADQDNGLLIYRAEQVTSTAPITLSPSHPLTLSLLTAWDTPGTAIGVAAAMSTVYVADGLGGVHILDTTNPAAPRLLGTYATASAANSVVISGTTLLVAAGWQGVLALDVSDPTAPYLAGSFDTPGYAHDLTLAGDLLLVADGPGGLQVLGVEQEAAPAHYLLIPFAAK